MRSQSRQQGAHKAPPLPPYTPISTSMFVYEKSLISDLALKWPQAGRGGRRAVGQRSEVGAESPACWESLLP